MSDRQFEGFVTVRQVENQGMITVRGDLAAKDISKALTTSAGVKMPAQSCANVNDINGLLWMSPDEAMVLCAFDDAQDSAVSLQKSLAAAHALVVNVSDARCVFDLQGAAVRQVLAKLAPLDTDPAVLATGMLRRTRMGQVACAFWMPTQDSARIICFRSVGDYMYKMLCAAATPGTQVFA